MATIDIVFGAEHGTSNGLLTGPTGSKFFDNSNGTLGTDIQILTAAAHASPSIYGLQISGSNNHVRWDSNTLPAGQMRVFGFWWKCQVDPSGSKQLLVFWQANGEAGIEYDPSLNKIKSYVTDFGTWTYKNESGTTNPGDWRWIDVRYNSSANPHRLDVMVDGVALTQNTLAVAATNITNHLLGDSSSSQTGTYYYDDLVGSATSGDYPLGEHSVRAVKVDAAGTVSLSGTAGNFQTFSGTTPTKVAWNVTTARDAVDELPPNVTSAQDGWCQITTASTEYVEMPMTTFTLGGDVVAGARMLAAVWAQDATGANFGLRSYNGTTERSLFGGTVSISGNNTASIPWICEMLTLADVNTQTEIDALCIRAGFSSDAAPDIGLHAVYVEFAVIPGTGNATSAVDITLGVAASGARNSEGSANVSVNIGVAAAGSRPSQGSANISVNIGLAGVGAQPPSQGSANISVNLGLAATGSSPNGGSAAVALTLGLAAAGSRNSQGSANVGLTLGVAATGARPSLGSADVGLTLGVAGVGFDLINKGSANLSVNVEVFASGVALSSVIPVRILTPEEILVGNRNTRFYLEVLDEFDSPIGRLDGVTGGKLDWLSNAVVKGGGDITVIDVDQQINWLSARLRPVMVIEGLPVQPLGIFLPAETPESYENGRKWAIKLLDKSTILHQDTISQTYALPSGSVITDEIVILIESAGITNHAITASVKTLDGDTVWTVGTSKLAIINDLLDQINYFSLFANFEGQMVGEPYTLPAQRPLSYEFIDGPGSIYRPNFTRDNDIWKIPNRLTLIGVGDGTTAALTSTIDNTDPLSPYSIAARGRVIGVTEQGVEAVDQAALDALARKRLVELTSPTAGVEIAHAPVPGLAVNQAARFARGPAGIDARHVVFRTAINLDGKALATSTLREVVDL